PHGLLDIAPAPPVDRRRRRIGDGLRNEPRVRRLSGRRRRRCVRARLGLCAALLSRGHTALAAQPPERVRRSHLCRSATGRGGGRSRHLPQPSATHHVGPGSARMTPRVALAGNNLAAVYVLELLLEALPPDNILVVAPPDGRR